MAIWQSAASQRASRLRRLAEKREREKYAPRVHMRRVRGEIKTVGPFRTRNKGAAEVRIVLSDFTPEQVAFFAPVGFEVGQEISLTLEEPKRFYVKGRVIFCQEHDANSHVLSETPFSYRMGIQFLFESKEEEKQVQAFCKLIHHEYVYSNLPASEAEALAAASGTEAADATAADDSNDDDDKAAA